MALGRVNKMDASEAAEQIRRVIRVELDDVEIAIKADNKVKALDELDDAMRKLKRIANDLA
jgi:hypothetical protein